MICIDQYYIERVTFFCVVNRINNLGCLGVFGVWPQVDAVYDHPLRMGCKPPSWLMA